MPARPRPSVGSFADFRIELFFKNADELRTQASFLHSRGVRRLNITNKVRPLATPATRSITVLGDVSGRHGGWPCGVFYPHVYAAGGDQCSQ